MYVAQPYSLIPPNQEYATKLKLAIDNVKGDSPNVNEQIERSIKYLDTQVK